MPYLSRRKQWYSKLQQTLDLDLHGGQRPLEDGQRLQTKVQKQMNSKQITHMNAASLGLSNRGTVICTVI